MLKHNGDVLAGLKFELKFLEIGGYWKASSHQQFVFQDSPACLNYGCSEDSRPCSECVFFRLVPLDRQNEKIPCRHIALNEQGETLISLYGRGAQQEVIETAVSRWLRAAIQELEREQAGGQSLHHELYARTEVVSISSQGDVKLNREATRFPKCANPECSGTFLFKEGRLCRFHRGVKDDKLPTDAHAVQHFWLCNACSESYTLE